MPVIGSINSATLVTRAAPRGVLGRLVVPAGIQGSSHIRICVPSPTRQMMSFSRARSPLVSQELRVHPPTETEAEGFSKRDRDGPVFAKPAHSACRLRAQSGRVVGSTIARLLWDWIRVHYYYYYYYKSDFFIFHQLFFYKTISAIK